MKKYLEIRNWLEKNNFEYRLLHNIHQYSKNNEDSGYKFYVDINISHTIYVDIKYRQEYYTNQGISRYGVIYDLETLEKTYKSLFPVEYRNYIITELLK